MSRDKDDVLNSFREISLQKEQNVHLARQLLLDWIYCRKDIVAHFMNCSRKRPSHSQGDSPVGVKTQSALGFRSSVKKKQLISTVNENRKPLD